MTQETQTVGCSLQRVLNGKDGVHVVFQHNLPKIP